MKNKNNENNDEKMSNIMAEKKFIYTLTLPSEVSATINNKHLQ